MARLPALFATAAVLALSLGLLTLRFALRSGMVVAWHKTSYQIPNSLICYGVALFFCLFAVLYSFWMIPWSPRARMWHFGLSVFCVGMFGAGLLGTSRFVGGQPAAPSLALLIMFSASPFLFLLVQGWYLVDGLRRFWPLVTRS